MIGTLLNIGYALATTSETHSLGVYEVYGLQDHGHAILGKQKEEKYNPGQVSDHRPLHVH